MIRATMVGTLIAASTFPREAVTSNFRVVELKSSRFSIVAEATSGYSGSNAEDEEYLTGWEAEARPLLERVRTHVEKDLEDLDFPLAKYSKALTEVMDETMDLASVSHFLETGNRPCRLRLVFYPEVFPLHRVDVIVALSNLPPDAERSRIRAAIQRGFERLKEERLLEQAADLPKAPPLPSLEKPRKE